MSVTIDTETPQATRATRFDMGGFVDVAICQDIPTRFRGDHGQGDDGSAAAFLMSWTLEGTEDH